MKCNAPGNVGQPPVKIIECGCCGHLHKAEFDGECRERNSRFTPDMLDERYGVAGWEIINVEY